MKNLPFSFVLVVMILLILPDTAIGFQQRQERDSLRFVSDSLMEVVRIKDSLLLQASLDSLFLHNLISVLDKENDSLQNDIRQRILKNKIDSVQQWERDSINQDFNRYSRWDLSDSLYNIDEDSVRGSLDDLLGVVFNDKSFSPEPIKLRRNMSRLFYHLSNDSLHFYLINSQNDTVPFVMKKNYTDSTAMFLVNNKKDSVKVFLTANGKSSIYMTADDDFRLAQMLKKKANPVIRKEWESLSKIKLVKHKVPVPPPEMWNTGGRLDIQLNQVALSHWARGGNNRISLLTKATAFANFKKGKVSWNNNILYRYGILKTEGVRVSKNIEQLQIKNSFHHKAFKNYNYSLSSQFDSQFFPTYTNPTDSIPISKFMGPARLSVGLGLNIKPTKELEITLDPLSSQFTIVLDTAMINQKKYGLGEDQRIKSELGTRVVMVYKKTLWKNVILNTNFTVFSSYVNNPTPDIDWVTDLRFQVNKRISTKLYVYLKYDDDVLIPVYDNVDGIKTKVGEGKFLQVQQTFGVNFTFHL